ncbi:MAG: branched-chain amino acid ABC transporter permease [Desulfatiglans sp.]|jgi:branched-chain amino acid transport system permease protein|nr:branched-chain amino acid ABC transporter permease [Thermodesulfobacteriota bacterium]MEE4353342.1 branched-chain amino acid ABC transporter permease [Desulfatiglans sp.]
MFDLPCGVFDMNYKKDMAIVRTKVHWGLLISFLVFLFCVPLIANEYWITMIDFMAISLISVLGLNIVTGYCGQINVGQAAFMAVGAYTSGILTHHYGFNFWIAFPCAGLVAAATGILFGLPSLRLKGFYLAMATLSAQFIIIWVIMRPLMKWSGGDYGLEVPYVTLGNITFNKSVNSFYLIIPVALFLIYLSKNISRMRVGRAFVAIRDNDLAAEVMGINIFQYKLLAFAISSFYAGIAGSLLAHTVGRASVDHFGLMESVWVLGMLIVGGMGSTMGAVFGTVFIKVLEEMALLLTPLIGSLFPSLSINVSTSLGPITFSLVVIFFLIYEPRGWAHRWEIFKNYYRLHPFAY